MRPTTILLLVIILVTGILSAGCSSTQAQPAVTETPTAQVVYVTATTAVTTIPSPTPTLSDECQQIVNNLDDDSAYVRYVVEHNIITRIGDLANYGCDSNAARQLNELLLKATKPKTPSLLKSRDYMISATTYCQIPDSAAPGRTYDDLIQASNKAEEYQDELIDCNLELENNNSDEVVSDNDHLTGTGDDVVSFTTTGSGLYIFTMKHTGSSNFAVWLLDEKGNKIDLLVNEIGSYSGKKSEQLTVGKYFLDITADGLWTVQVAAA